MKCKDWIIELDGSPLKTMLLTSVVSGNFQGRISRIFCRKIGIAKRGSGGFILDSHKIPMAKKEREFLLVA